MNYIYIPQSFVEDNSFSQQHTTQREAAKKGIDNTPARRGGDPNCQLVDPLVCKSDGLLFSYPQSTEPEDPQNLKEKQCIIMWENLK